MSENILDVNGRLTIPLHEIDVHFTHSSGPGGQHANKAETKVILSFDIALSPTLHATLTPAEHKRLLGRLRSRLDSSGVLQVAAQDTRSQSQNRQIAMDRLRQILADALKKPKPRKKTRPSRAARERRLEEKRRRGRLKKERSWTWKRER